MQDVRPDVWSAELEEVLVRVGHRFGRVDLRRQMRAYVNGLLAPMEPADVVSAFAYIRAIQARDVDTACSLVEGVGVPDMHQALLEVAERVVIPVTAVDDRDGAVSADSFMAEALGRLILDILRVDDVCPAIPPGIARAIIRSTEEHQDVADVLRRLEAAGIDQAMQAYGPPAERSSMRSTGV